jgi:hypothetical protein
MLLTERLQDRRTKLAISMTRELLQWAELLLRRTLKTTARQLTVVMALHLGTEESKSKHQHLWREATNTRTHACLHHPVWRRLALAATLRQCSRSESCD